MKITMNINELCQILNTYENKTLPITISGNNSLIVDITDMNVVEDGKTLLLYENSYYTKTGKHLLSPIKTINDLLSILDGIKDKDMLVKGRGANGMLVSPTGCTVCYVDDFAMLNLYDKTIPITIQKAKQDAEIFIDNLHTD